MELTSYFQLTGLRSSKWRGGGAQGKPCGIDAGGTHTAARAPFLLLPRGPARCEGYRDTGFIILFEAKLVIYM